MSSFPDLIKVNVAIKNRLLERNLQLTTNNVCLVSKSYPQLQNEYGPPSTYNIHKSLEGYGFQLNDSRRYIHTSITRVPPPVLRFGLPGG